MTVQRNQREKVHYAAKGRDNGMKNKTQYKARQKMMACNNSNPRII